MPKAINFFIILPLSFGEWKPGGPMSGTIRKPPTRAGHPKGFDRTPQGADENFRHFLIFLKNNVTKTAIVRNRKTGKNEMTEPLDIHKSCGQRVGLAISGANP